MAKISLLDPIEEPTGDETVVVLDGNRTRRAPLRALVEASAKPILDDAKDRVLLVGVQPNQNVYGRTMLEMGAYNSPQYDEITDPSLRARGFVTSMRDISGAKQTYAIGSFDQPNLADTSAVFRYGLIAASPGNFGSPRVVFVRADGSLAAPILADLESEESPTIRWYTLRVPAMAAEYVSYFAGTQEWVGGAGDEVRVFGVQHHRSSTGAFSIHPDDYPAPDADNARMDQVNLPPRFFLTDGNPPLPLFLQNAFPDRVVGVRATLASSPGLIPIIQQADGGTIQLRAEDIGTSLQIVLSQPALRGNKRWIGGNEGGGGSTAVEKGAFAITGDVRFHLAADSLGNRYMLALINQMLLARGVAATFLGTVEQAGGGLGEAREGRSWAWYAGLAGGVQSVPIGGEDAYRAFSPQGKIAYNPYINPNTGKFDFALYVARFLGGIIPTHFVIALGTNDIVEAINAGAWRSGAYLALIKQALAIMVASIKAVSGGIYIGLVQHTTAQMDDPVAWRMHSAVIRECIRFVNNPFDPAVSFIPAYLHQSPELSFPTPVDLMMVDTHLNVAHVGDPLHGDGEFRAMAATPICNWIGCRR